ncbi:MAG: recombinase family protein [Clostridiales bacterium]|nr:recombinase family protein [Clostridiales bacterium]
MARKSRKKPVGLLPEVQQALDVAALEVKLPTAAYARLSSGNSGNETDDSIQTQVMLIHDFIREHKDLQLIDTYVDNGYSGMNFDRPEFERLMGDVRSGKIKCIVVKDLSRFGRDYLETGYYLETIFPHLKVRFIAVTDDFDNSRQEDMESLAVPIKNMVNGMYARDISKKLVSVYEMKRERGDLLNGFPPYGYVIDEEKNNYAVDESKACYIRVMYQWFLMGVSKYEITKRLDLLKAPRPREKRLDETLEENNGPWQTSTIGRYLENPIFAGDLASGKTKRAAYKGLKPQPVERDDWVLHRDHHEAVVLRSDYDAVQKILAGNKRTRKERLAKSEKERAETTNVFRGIIYCGCCGRHMTFMRCKHTVGADTSYGTYFCKSKDETALCRNHSIPDKLLRILVMDQINLMIKAMCDRGRMVKCLMDGKDEGSKVASIQKKITSLSYRIEQTEERKTVLYEDYVGGLLEKEEYQCMKERYISERQKLEERLREASQTLQSMQKKARLIDEQVKHLEHYLDCREFDEGLVRELVDAIYIGIDNSIEIRFKCNDAYQQWLDCTEVDEDVS